MNPTKKTKQEDLQTLQLGHLRRESLSPAQLAEDKLELLQAFVRHLAHTPNGQSEIQLRKTRFGVCERLDGEASNRFYGRLRDWLDRDLFGRTPRAVPAD